MSVLPLRYATLLLCAGALFAAGCIPAGTTVRHDRRIPETRPVSSRSVYGEVARDARRYVRDLDRALRLNRRQERRIERLLIDRATDRVRRARHRDAYRANPFPRRYAHHATRNWWDHTDRRIERELNRHQRRIYRDLVRHAERRAHRDRQRHRDYERRRDDDWDDDDWGDGD